MIHSLLIVMWLSLATGVGALAPSPVSIKEDKQETSQKQYRQLNEEIERENFSVNFDWTTIQNGNGEISSENDLTFTYAKAQGNYTDTDFTIKVTKYYYTELQKYRTTPNTMWSIYQDWLATTPTTRIVLLEINPSKTIDTVSLTFRETIRPYVLYYQTATQQVGTWTLTNTVYTTTADESALSNYANDEMAIYRIKQQINTDAFQIANTKKIIYNETTLTGNNKKPDSPYEIQIENFMYANRKTYVTIVQDVSFKSPANYESDYIIHYNDSYDSIWQEVMTSSRYTLTGQFILTDGTIHTEVVDIPGLMWEILSMPFAFISTAFNLTLFPGTPYQINISNLFLTIIGLLILVFILKLIISRFK